jgi:hypothetical protein
MATIWVQSVIDLKCKVTEKKVTNTPPPNDGDQFFDKYHCVTQKIDRNEWRWRFETAKSILCSGYADTTGYYLGDVLGGQFV